MTFCETCNDSGEVEAKSQPHNGPTQYVMCTQCPRCDNPACDMRVEQGDGPGRVEDRWVCDPTCGALIFTDHRFIEDAIPDHLVEAAEALYSVSREKDPDPKDKLLLARICSLIAKSLEKQAYRATLPPSKAVQHGPLPRFLRDVVMKGGPS